MAEYAPDAIHALYNYIKSLIPSAQLSGILGDRAHTYGYHRARNVLPAGDYSRQYAGDKLGDGWAASALDVKLSAADMKTVSARLRAAIKAKDPRLKALREFGGTLNGTDTFASDRLTGRESWNDWDDTHLWHIHLSIFRGYANTAAALRGIAEVMAGKPMTVPQKVVAAVTSKPKPPAFPLPSGHYYGLISGPNWCHGGYYASERPAVKLIQQRLQALGYAPKTAGWADGKFEQPTKDAVMRWQRAKKYTVNGVITAAGWGLLFK